MGHPRLMTWYRWCQSDRSSLPFPLRASPRQQAARYNDTNAASTPHARMAASRGSYHMSRQGARITTAPEVSAEVRAAADWPMATGKLTSQVPYASAGRLPYAFPGRLAYASAGRLPYASG